MVGFSTVFIFLILLILLRLKRRGHVMDREERFYALLEISLLVLFGVFSLQLSTLTLLAPFIPIVIYAIEAILCIIPIAAVYRKRKKINQVLTNKYLDKLRKKIQKELETEATAKNLAFPHQLKDDVLSKLANRVSSDIMNVPNPINYSVQPMNDRVGDVDVYLGGHILAVPIASAQVLADKMTELSKAPQYRKKWKLLLLP
jgi:energy-coupling factor transporter transmembrane protein EcfT